MNERIAAAGALLALTLATAACTATPDAPQNPETVEASVLRIEPATLPQSFDVSGTVESTTRSVLASKLLGNVVAVHVSEGDRVHRGQVLLEIDGAEVDAQLVQARGGLDEIERSIAATTAAADAAAANLTLARNTRERYQKLWERRSISAQENDEVEARHRAAEAESERMRQTLSALRARREQVLAEVARARAASSWAKISSPIDGVVVARRVDPGAQAAPGVPLLEIADPASHRLDVWVDESRVTSVRSGQPVRVILGHSPEELTGTVQHIAPAVAATTRSALVKVALPADSRLRSGLFARARFETGTRSGVTVPASALVRRGQLEGVWVVAEGKALFRLVRTGDRGADGVEILSGLEPGETIVSEAGPRLRDGMAITQRLASKEPLR